MSTFAGSLVKCATNSPPTSTALRSSSAWPFSRENYRMMREELLKIVYWKPGDNEGPNGMARPAAKDRVEAVKSVVMLDLALLSAEIANGMYKKPIEEIAKTIPTCAGASTADARLRLATGSCSRAIGWRRPMARSPGAWCASIAGCAPLSWSTRPICGRCRHSRRVAQFARLQLYRAEDCVESYRRQSGCASPQAQRGRVSA
jgi:hypothetical protein